MRSRPLPLLPFDCVGAEQLEWDGATDEITFAAPIGQTFCCTQPALHRLEVFIEPTFHFKRSHLWLLVFAGDDAAAHASAPPRPLRVAGPLATESVLAHGWLAFEFEPIADSGGKTFTLLLQAPDAAPGNALAVRSSTRAAGDRGLSVAGRPQAGALTFRAACLRAPALLANFRRFRRHATERGGTADYRPLLVRLEISRPCNLHCVMCQRGLHPFDASREAPGFMSLPTVRALDPLLPTLLRVIAFGLGEPFLNPQYLAILRHVRSRNAFAHVFTSTNGTCLGDEAIAALLDERLLDELQISLDGAERETFESIRRKASFDTVVRAFERVVTARARRRERTLSITGAMLVMKANATQIVAFAQRMAGLGVDRVSFDSPKDAAFKPLRVDTDAGMARVMEQVVEAGEMLAGTGTQLSGPLLNELLDWHRQSGQPGDPPRWGLDECAQLAPRPGARRSACNVPWESFSLAADGAVQVCCNSNRLMGHVHRATDGGFWETGAPYAQLRGELITRVLHADCRTCLGENFVVPGEMTPAGYVDGCVCDSGHTAGRAQQVGQPVAPDCDQEAPPLRGGIDTIDWRGTENPALSRCRLSGWIETPEVSGVAPIQVQPIELALSVDRVVCAYTGATRVAGGIAQWSAVMECDSRRARPGAIEVHLVAGAAWRKIALQGTRPSAPVRGDDGGRLHGFVDEVRRTGGSIHFIGWARQAGARTPAARVVVAIAGQPVRSIRPWLPRPDVARAFGDSATGFGYSIELPLQLGAAEPSLALLAVDERGNSAPIEWSAPARLALESYTGYRDNGNNS